MIYNQSLLYGMKILEESPGRTEGVGRTGSITTTTITIIIIIIIITSTSTTTTNLGGSLEMLHIDL